MASSKDRIYCSFLHMMPLSIIAFAFARHGRLKICEYRKMVGVTHAHVARSVQKMLKCGLVELVGGKPDRSSFYYLTDKGFEVGESAHYIVTRIR